MRLTPALAAHAPLDHPARGWSLPELLTVLALVAFGMHVALPTWQSWQARMHVTAARDLLMMDLQTARVHARQQARTLSLQPLRDCAWHNRTDTDWSCGWQLVEAAASGASTTSTSTSSTLFTTPLSYPLQVSFTQAQALTISERGDLGQVGARWTLQTQTNQGVVAHAICLSAGSRVRTIASATCS